MFESLGYIPTVTGVKIAFFRWVMVPMPKSNAEFWHRKFELNQERDKRKRRALEEAGWTVLRFWEHEIRDDLGTCVDRVAAEVGR